MVLDLIDHDSDDRNHKEDREHNAQFRAFHVNRNGKESAVHNTQQDVRAEVEEHLKHD